MWKNFLAGMIIEYFIHIPLLLMTRSSYIVIWAPTYLVSGFLIGTFMFLLYDLRNESFQNKKRMASTYAGMILAFFLTRRYLL